MKIIGDINEILTSCHSTNQFLKERFNHDMANGHLVATFNQTEGKGQRGNIWLSEKDKNLCFSFVLKNLELDPLKQFELNYFVSLGCLDYLKSKLNKIVQTKLKWPNDLYVNDLKIGGILIENFMRGSNISHSIVGIGLNINQLEFEGLRACSLKSFNGNDYNLQNELGSIVECLNFRFEEYLLGKDLKQEYVTELLGFQKWRKYLQISNNQYFIAKIIDVLDSGEVLLVDDEEVIRKFELKQLQFIFE